MKRKPKAAVADHSPSEIHPNAVGAAAPQASEVGLTAHVFLISPADPLATNAAAGQSKVDTQRSDVGGGTTEAGDGDHTPLETHEWGVAALAPTIAVIRGWHRYRVLAMGFRKSIDLQMGAFVRSTLGWSRNKPAAENDAIRARASDLLALGEKLARGKIAAVDDSAWAELGPAVMASIQSRSVWDDIEKNSTKNMELLAETLPVWPAFGEPIKGFGARSLAVIIGETGDLNLYANPAKVWKRMGLAVMDGVRQGGLRKNAGADAWIAHGYNAKRRSFMFVIGDVLIKNQNPYRDLYLERKGIEHAKAAERGLTVAPSAKIPPKRKDEFMSDGHIHRRAQRYMEKRLLRDLWSAWRRANKSVQSKLCMPAANSKTADQ